MRRRQAIVSRVAESDLKLGLQFGKSSWWELRASSGELEQSGKLLRSKMRQGQPKPFDQLGRSRANDNTILFQIRQVVLPRKKYTVLVIFKHSHAIIKRYIW